MSFERVRRLRKTKAVRMIFKETILRKEDLIYPIFLVEGNNKEEEIENFPCVYRYSIDRAIKKIEFLLKNGVHSVLLFGIPTYKDEFGSSAFDSEQPVQRGVKELRKLFGDDLVIFTDVCLCQYTTHGHCGIVKEKDSSFYIDNDLTLEQIGKVAISHALAGVDFVCPSDMMDGRVKIIREALDKNGFFDVGIMSYSAKFASSLYGPFRNAANSAPSFGDRKTYQMSIGNKREALREALADDEEGADIIMVKPGLFYLDIVQKVKENTLKPVAVYMVSGEYSMIKSAGKMGYLDEEKVMLEAHIALKRAGADLIVTYFAEELAKII